jgi:hypothetical protein
MEVFKIGSEIQVLFELAIDVVDRDTGFYFIAEITGAGRLQVRISPHS